MGSAIVANKAVTVEALREQVLELISGERWGFILLSPEIDAVRSASSYAELLGCVNRVLAGFLLHNVLDAPLTGVQSQLVGQLARIEREHEADTSVGVLSDRVVGIVAVTGYSLLAGERARLSDVATYDQLHSVVVVLSRKMEAYNHHRAHARLRNVLNVLDAKLAQQ